MPVLINGTNYSNCNLQNIAFGVPVSGITEISYSIKQTKELNYGAGIEPVSVGFGNKTYEGSITVYKDWWQSVINASPNKDPLSILPFDWTISYGNSSSPFTPTVPIVTETLKSLMFLEDSMKSSQGETKILITIPFIFAGKVTT